ncbi:MAG: TrkH family potassium uptake protein [Alphaproteobacteria bacterium]
MNFRPIAFLTGLLLSGLAIAMTPPAAADLLAGNRNWLVFVAAAGLTLFVGVGLAVSCWQGRGRFSISVRETFVMTTVSWAALAVFAALPFVFADLNLSYTDAFFEAMSGLTTTGSTVIVGLDFAAPGLLLWRALLQWIGGIGIVVTAIAVLPALQVGGMQLFRAEASEQNEKVLPRAAQIASGIGGVYLAGTMLVAAGYWLVGMNGFDAVTHAMTTIATGGYANYDASFSAFEGVGIPLVATFGMIMGSLPFIAYLKAIRVSPRLAFRDPQSRGFLAATAVFVVFVLAARSWEGIDAPLTFFAESAFNVVSIMTGTGYTIGNFETWGAFATPTFLLLMFVGGCAGSTTCAIKIFRFQVLFSAAQAQLRRLARPHRVAPARYSGKPLTPETINSVMAFFFLYIVCFIALSIGLSLTGVEGMTAISGAASAISNVGPGLGAQIGPTGNYAGLPDTAKWLLALGMLVGRLELFTVLILLMPRFWRS